MRTRTLLLMLVAVALVSTAGPLPAVHAGVYTQTESIPSTDTNFDTTTPSLAGVNPLVFSQYDPSQHNGEQLQSVDIKVTYDTVNSYQLTLTTPSTVTLTAITPGPASDPNATLSPTVETGTGWPLSSFQPIFQAEQYAGSALSKSITLTSSSTFPQSYGSNLPTNSPNYIAPVTTNATLLSTPITATDSTTAADFTKFQGPGTIAFPFTALGTSLFSSTSGNGFGLVSTQADVQMTVTYNTGPAVPEPTSLALLGLGAAGLVGVRRWRRRRD